jgi:hypothetical protein
MTLIRFGRFLAILVSQFAEIVQDESRAASPIW